MTAGDTFNAGVEQIEAVIAAERSDATIDPRCLSVLMHHGHATERGVVLFHGFTNCPRQFAVFGQQMFEHGYNVYIPRLPHHGLRDKLTTALDALTVEALIESATSAMHIAAPLAGSRRALGLSLGATMVAWLAQHYALDRVIAVSPFFSIAHVPALLEPVFAGALELVPNLELWWDPHKKAAAGPDHGYPRFSTHALARCLDLGGNVRAAARKTPPLAADITLVLNGKDPAIDNTAAVDVWQLWRDRRVMVDEYEFDNLDARHDIIEPQTYPAAVDLVYPVLRALLER